MKTVAIKLFKYLLRLVGFRKLLKMAWSYALYPRLKEYTKNSDPEWDEKVLEVANKYVYKVIDMF